MQKERTFTLEFGDESAQITYWTNSYTPILEQESREMLDSDMPGSSLATMLAGMLVSWEVLDKNNQPTVPDYETLSKYPAMFLRAVLDGIVADQTADREEIKNSSSTSARPARKAPARRGTR